MDKNLIGKWMYNFGNEEIWDGDCFDTKEDAINEAKAELANDKPIREKRGLKPIREFYVGRTEAVSPCGIDVDSILDGVAENTTEGNEAGEDYLCNVTREDSDELEQKLNEVLFAWMKEHGYEPDFFSIVNTEKVII